jgi:hypothetical protein
MASGRNQVDYTDIDRMDITMKIDAVSIVFDQTKAMGAADTMIGKAVSLSANDTVQLIGDAEGLFGKLIQVFADGFCRVQVRGYADLPGGDGATLTRGKAVVGDLGASSAEGYIREVATAVAAELGVMHGKIVNNADTAAVIVDLG